MGKKGQGNAMDDSTDSLLARLMPLPGNPTLEGALTL
jgi:hypothetical protein